MDCFFICSAYVTICMNRSGSKLKIKSKHYLWIHYRHPNDNMAYDKFLGYLELCLSKLSNENKEVYLCGDFNSDLLKLDGVNNYKTFYELMSSYGYLPQILQPTRIQGDSATIIDNIFTNTCNMKIQSGNIITDFSDHYSQFVSTERERLPCIKEITQPFQKIASEMIYPYKISITILKTLMINLNTSI